jgi:ABC-type multidrug transport system fused ATPase/permease subunit
MHPPPPFLAARSYIKWLYYINPIAYGLSALNVNELTSPSWGAPDADDPSITLGQRVLDTYEMHSDPSWLWVCVGYLAGLLVVLTAATAEALRFTTLPGPQPTVADGEGGAGGEAPAKGAPGGDAELSKSLTAQLSRRRGAAAPAPAPAGAAAAAPVTVVCTHVTYCVPCPKGAAPSEDATKPGMLQLLRDITFTARPGRLTALMGGSGAGKTTLMDVVCGRKTTGHIGGEILVNGHPKVQASWARVMG